MSPASERRNRLQDLHLLVPHRLAVHPRRRLQRQVAQQLEQVVLDDVADRAGGVVEPAAALDAEVFRHGDLHALDMRAVPEGLHHRVGEPEEEHVVDRALAQVVVDPEDVALRERAEQDAIQIARRGQVVAERLLDDDARARGATGVRQLLDDRSEQHRRDGQIVRRMRDAGELAAQRRERRRIAVVAVDVAQPGAQPGEGVAVQPAVFLDAVLRPRPQLVERPARLGHADDRHVQLPAPGHRLERRKDLLERQIAGGSEEHQRIGSNLAHGPSRVHAVTCRRPSRGVRRTDIASPTTAGSGSRLRRAS